MTVAFFYDQEGVHHAWQQAYPFPIIKLNIYPPGEGTHPLRLLFGLPRLYHFLRKQRFEIVESFTHHANLLVLPPAWLAGIPVRVASHHGMFASLPQWLNRLHAWVITSSITLCMVAVSEQVCSSAAWEENIRADKIIVIHNGTRPLPCQPFDPARRAALSAELGLKPGGHLICSVGRLTEQKGHRFLLEAIPRVIREYPEITFAIAGGGPLLSELQEQARALNIADNVLILGDRSDIAELLSLAELFVLPSLSEALPIALLEAMGAGVPAIASQVGGVTEIIVHNQTGLLVPPADSEAISQAILRLLAEPEFRVNLSAQGKALVEKEFNQDQMCTRYRNLFENLLEGSK